MRSMAAMSQELLGMSSEHDVVCGWVFGSGAFKVNSGSTLQAARELWLEGSSRFCLAGNWRAAWVWPSILIEEAAGKNGDGKTSKDQSSRLCSAKKKQTNCSVPWCAVFQQPMLGR